METRSACTSSPDLPTRRRSPNGRSANRAVAATSVVGSDETGKTSTSVPFGTWDEVEPSLKVAPVELDGPTVTSPPERSPGSRRVTRSSVRPGACPGPLSESSSTALAATDRRRLARRLAHHRACPGENGITVGSGSRRELLLGVAAESRDDPRRELAACGRDPVVGHRPGARDVGQAGGVGTGEPAEARAVDEFGARDRPARSCPLRGRTRGCRRRAGTSRASNRRTIG